MTNCYRRNRSGSSTQKRQPDHVLRATGPSERGALWCVVGMSWLSHWKIWMDHVDTEASRELAWVT